MKRLLMLLTMALLITGCGTSVKGAEGNCEKVGQVDKTNNVFKACLNVSQKKMYFSDGEYFTKGFVLGELVIFRSQISEVDGWISSDIRKSIGFRKTDSEFMNSLWDAEAALKFIELVSKGDKRWDGLISSIAKYSNSSSCSKKLIRKLFSERKQMSGIDQTCGDEAKIYSDSLSGELEVFLSYLRTETGLSNYEAARVTLEYLRFSKGKK